MFPLTQPNRRAARLQATLLPAFLLWATALAGCVGDDTTSSAAAGPAHPESPAGPADGDAEETVARFSAATKPLRESIWANGTYQLQEHTWPTWMVTGLVSQQPPGLRFVDLTQLVPKNVPVRLIAEVHAELANGDLDIWFELPFDEYWTGEWDTPFGGYSRIELVVVHASDEPVRAALLYDEADSRSSFDYTWNVRVETDPDLLYAGVPVGVDLDGVGSTLSVELVDPGAAPAVWVFDPDDRFLGRFPIEGNTFEFALGDADDAGEYVVLLAAGSGVARVRVHAADADAPSEPRMRTLVARIIQSDMRHFPGPGFEWTFEAPAVPLQVGYHVMSGTLAKDFHATLSSPTQTLLDSTFTGGPWVRPVDGFGTFEFTDVGAQGLVAGTYAVEGEFEVANGPEPIMGTDFLVYYAR